MYAYHRFEIYRVSAVKTLRFYPTCRLTSQLATVSLIMTETRNSCILDDRLLPIAKTVARVSLNLCCFPDLLFPQGNMEDRVTWAHVVVYVTREEFRAKGPAFFEQAANGLVCLSEWVATETAQYQAMGKSCSLAHSARTCRDIQDLCWTASPT